MLTVKLDNPPPSHLNAFQLIITCVRLQRFSSFDHISPVTIFLSEKEGKKDVILQCIPESTRVITFCKEKQTKQLAAVIKI